MCPKNKNNFALASNELSFMENHLRSTYQTKTFDPDFSASGPAIDLRKEKTPNLPYLMSGKPVIYDMFFKSRI